MTGSATIRQAARELEKELRLFESAKIGDPVVHLRRWKSPLTGGMLTTRTATYIRAIAGELFTVTDCGGVYRIADGTLDDDSGTAWVEIPKAAIPPEAAAAIEGLREMLRYPNSDLSRIHAEAALREYDTMMSAR